MSESKITVATGNVINLKENVFIVPYGSEIPKEAKKMLASSMKYMSEFECKWYVSICETTKRSTDYVTGRRLNSATKSLESAVKKLYKKENITNDKFLIYCID